MVAGGWRRRGTREKLLNVAESHFPGKAAVSGQDVPGLCSLSWLMLCSVNFIHSIIFKTSGGLLNLEKSTHHSPSPSILAQIAEAGGSPESHLQSSF